MRQIFIGRRTQPARPTISPSSASSTSSASASRTPSATRASAQRGMFYVPSLSCKTLIYKGMLNADQVPPFFPDLRDPAMEIGPGAGPFALQHQHLPELGAGASRTATSRTTARSTRCAATSTGCTPARACSPRELFGDDIKKILPIIDAERQRLGHVRQRPGTARAGRPVAAARRHDDDPRAVERRPDA